MPSYFVTQPNGKYALFSTITDSFTAYDHTEAECKAWYAQKGLIEPFISEQWRRVLDDVIPHQEHRPCCDQKPLRRWHDCLNTILHAHGTAKLFAILSEIKAAWSIAADPDQHPMERTMAKNHKPLFMVKERDCDSEWLSTESDPKWYETHRPAKEEEVTLFEMANILDQDAESANYHSFVGIHKRLADVMLEESGMETATRIMRTIVDWGGLHPQ